MHIFDLFCAHLHAYLADFTSHNFLSLVISLKQTASVFYTSASKYPPSWSSTLHYTRENLPLYALVFCNYTSLCVSDDKTIIGVLVDTDNNILSVFLWRAGRVKLDRKTDLRPAEFGVELILTRLCVIFESRSMGDFDETAKRRCRHWACGDGVAAGERDVYRV